MRSTDRHRLWAKLMASGSKVYARERGDGQRDLKDDRRGGKGAGMCHPQDPEIGGTGKVGLTLDRRWRVVWRGIGSWVALRPRRCVVGSTELSNAPPEYQNDQSRCVKMTAVLPRASLLMTSTVVDGAQVSGQAAAQSACEDGGPPWVADTMKGPGQYAASRPGDVECDEMKVRGRLRIPP